MSNEKRFITFVIVVFLWMMASSYLSRMMGWAPPPPKKPPALAGDPATVKGEVLKPNLAKAGERPTADGGVKAEADQTKDKLKAGDTSVIKSAPASPEI